MTEDACTQSQNKANELSVDKILASRDTFEAEDNEPASTNRFEPQQFPRLKFCFVSGQQKIVPVPRDLRKLASNPTTAMQLEMQVR